jgi:hypothetical protein
MDITLKEYERMRRKRPEYFAVYTKYADRHKTKSISANFRAKPKKNYILNSPPRYDRMGKKAILRYSPFKNALILGKNDVKCAPNELVRERK